MMHRIGITVREVAVDNTLKEFVNTAYLKFLNNREELIPIIISATTKNVTKLLDICDGFLITGGDDLDPLLYGEENICSEITPKKIDDLDKVIVEYCVKNRKPLLGICRGLQSLNVFLGGSLHQDISNHKKGNHLIEIDKDSQFYKVCGQYIEVNTYHHQAINRLAEGLRPLAYAKDGIIEIVEHKFLPIFAVQFHPELFNDKIGLMILDYFITLLNK